MKVTSHAAWAMRLTHSFRADSYSDHFVFSFVELAWSFGKITTSLKLFKSAYCIYKSI